MRLSTNKLLQLLFIFALPACHSTESNHEEIKPRSTVSLTHIRKGLFTHEEELSATAQYLRHNSVTAPVAGYIKFVKLNFNDRVSKGQLLYTLETKERQALGNSVDDELNDKNYGRINVYAPMSGVVTTLSQSQEGVFVQEGTVLCGISDNSSLYFQVNIPYEYRSYLRQNTNCTLILPDNTRIPTRLQAPIMQTNNGLQTIPYMAKPLKNIYVPAGIIATARLVTYQNPSATMLPKSSVLSDELMHNYWVMKLINDSTAIKVPVKIGAQNDSLIEIKTPLFSQEDAILETGNYGLSDTALVKVFN
jgi:multidrug efflux pump subunit AcrA (membrane-fusion protein)